MNTELPKRFISWTDFAKYLIKKDCFDTKDVELIGFEVDGDYRNLRYRTDYIKARAFEECKSLVLDKEYLESIIHQSCIPEPDYKPIIDILLLTSSFILTPK